MGLSLTEKHSLGWSRGEPPGAGGDGRGRMHWREAGEADAGDGASMSWLLLSWRGGLNGCRWTYGRGRLSTQEARLGAFI